MAALIFPGQGSQSRGMVRVLFDLPEYRALEAEVDTFLGYSMRQLCADNPENRLQETQFTQPALFVANALSYYKAVADGMRPTHVAGHSLGEYSALLAAGTFDFMTGLRLVHKRGELMAATRNGGMHAVIGLTVEKIAAAMKDIGAADIDFANFNSPSQVVISGPTAELARLAPVLEKAGAAMCIPLCVSAAFHSRYMAAAAMAFAEFLHPISFMAPSISVISNVTAQPYEADESAIKALLVRQVTEPVRWAECIRYLLDAGVGEIKEIGPGTVLSRLLQEIRQSAPR